MSTSIYKRIRDFLAAGERFALVTVVKASGSTPRGSGAKMIVDRQGRTVGTIGGGCPEAEAWQEAKAAAKSGRRTILQVNLAHSGDSITDDDQAMICGGRLQAFVEPLQPGTPEAGTLLRGLNLLIDEGRPFVSIICLSGSDVSADPVAASAGCAAPDAACGKASEPAGEGEEVPAFGTRWIYTMHGLEAGPAPAGPALSEALQNLADSVAVERRPRTVSVSIGAVQAELFAEYICPARRFYIAGAGHVSRPLSHFANMCGFKVYVNDDRPQYADPKLFDSDVEVSALPFDDFWDKVRGDLDEDCAVVLVTRGHKHDEYCLRSLKDAKLGYLGMIGSRRRTVIIIKRLLDDGFDPAWLAQVHAPIGLDLGGETPEEIGVAIMAEVISTFNKTKAADAGLSAESRAKLAEGK